MENASMAVYLRRMLTVAFVLVLVPFTASQAQGQTFSVIYSFVGESDGAYPLAGFVMDAAGNLYGTASNGGGNFGSGSGVVFKMTLSGQETVLYTFTGGADGATPEARLLIDSAGNLYGTTNAGGAHGLGTVFKVTQSGQETVLYSFAGGTVDGANPQASLAMDSAHNVYGTTYSGGAYGAGTVFRLSKTGKETVLYNFGNGTDGAHPVAGVTLGPAGEVYGTTSAGGANTYGTVFQLTPMEARESKYKETILHDFTHQDDGDVPYAGLIFDRAGNLYGAATGGGINNGGTIFELTPSATGWNFAVLYSLPGWDISGAFQNLFMDSSGNLWGTTHCDGAEEAGTIYELTNSGGAWSYTSLYVFTGGTDGLYSFSNLVFDNQGNLYGTVDMGGANFHGAVFKVTP